MTGGAHKPPYPPGTSLAATPVGLKCPPNLHPWAENPLRSFVPRRGSQGLGRGRRSPPLTAPPARASAPGSAPRGQLAAPRPPDTKPISPAARAAGTTREPVPSSPLPLTPRPASAALLVSPPPAPQKEQPGPLIPGPGRTCLLATSGEGAPGGAPEIHRGRPLTLLSRPRSLGAPGRPPTPLPPRPSASEEQPARPPGKMARWSRHRLLLLLLRYLVVALGYHKVYGVSAPKDQVVTAIEYQGDFKDRAEMIDFSIRIKNVTRSDAGQYRCEVSAPTEQGQNLEEDMVTLEVLVAPAVPSCEVPSSALRGTVVELRCQDKEGNPAPEYTWFKDGVRLLGNSKLGSQSTNSSYTVNSKSGTLQFNTISQLDSGEYSCEARNSVGYRRCPGKRMQVDDLNIGGIIAAVVVVALVISICGLGVCYAQRKGYFSKESTFQKNSSASKATTLSENDFKHTKSFII
ncbi:junctional adhesion molecule B [Trichechus manatus latirostris]|uniref:Junctional adhesion molecule B n=1 Tax=Trichechus manatus latirostris TaxID=127582 RepID=A0A2Y9QT49_TRIMA|nr:junctional adhesion molecule B [Trichechus manatus latirostris]